MKKILIPFIFFVFGSLVAQSIDYEKMLNSLLKKTTEPINISKAVQQKEAIFLDTRSKKEFMVSHIKNAQWVGFDEFRIIKLKNIPKARQIIVYCSIGARSEQIGEKLKIAGYTNVQNLWGGIFQWVNEGQPVYNHSGNITQKVHAYSPEWGIWLNKGEKVYN